MKRQPNREKILAELDDWPKAWMGLPSDLELGQRLVEAMRPFVVALIADGLTIGTVGRHLNGLWLLGGHIVADASDTDDPDLQALDGRELLLRYIDDESGPLVRHLHTEDDQRQFDSTCRKLHRFLTTNPAV